MVQVLEDDVCERRPDGPWDVGSHFPPLARGSRSKRVSQSKGALVGSGRVV